MLELTDESGDEITAVGPLALSSVGERVEITGEWTEHKAYGRQFKARKLKPFLRPIWARLSTILAAGLSVAWARLRRGI